VPTNGLFAEALDVAEGACGIEKRRDGGGSGRGRRARRR